MIRLERRDRGIVWLIVDRPQARNAMTFAMWDRLREIAVELDADEAVRVIVFTGAGGRAFIAGTDIAEFRSFTSGEDGIAYEHRMEAVISALESIRVPTIAAIAGACTGGGVSVAGTCDLRIGAAGTRIGVPIARTLGNCVSLRNVGRGGALIGLDAAKRLLLTGTLVDAPAAHTLGFLSEIAESDEALPAHAQRVATQIAALAPLTLRATKEMVRRLRRAIPAPSDEDLVRLCYGSADFREGMDAFLSKRPANWTGC
jgi:enoyl-CoA hydratase/carnithine racemase